MPIGSKMGENGRGLNWRPAVNNRYPIYSKYIIMDILISLNVPKGVRETLV